MCQGLDRAFLFPCHSFTQVKQVVPEKEKEVLEQITWMLDKQENETLPQVTLNSLEVSGCVRGMVDDYQAACAALYLVCSSSLTM